MQILLLLLAGASFALPTEEPSDTDGDQSRKILGSSVVTSVSVIMDTGNGSKTVYTDAVGKPMPKPSSASEVASPINLLNPDRYEFYTFDDNGDLIKRLMSLEEIQGIIATGDSDGYDLDAFTSLGYLPEKRVNDVVNNVQSVLKVEMETHKNPPNIKPMFDTPDVSDSWSMILPAVFGNSGEDIKPERPIAHVTPDTIMIEPNMENNFPMSSAKTNTPVNTTAKPLSQTEETSQRPSSSISTPRSTTQVHVSSPSFIATQNQISTDSKVTTLKTGSTNKFYIFPITEPSVKPVVNVEIYSNSKSTDRPTPDQQAAANSEYVEIKRPDTNKDDPNAHFATTSKPLTTPQILLFAIEESSSGTDESAKTDVSTKAPSTFVTFVSSSAGSTLSTTPINTKVNSTNTTATPISSTSANVTPKPTTAYTQILTKYTGNIPISTWRPVPIESSTPNITLSSRKPVTTIDQLQNNLPTLADILNWNNIETTQTEQPTLSTTTSDDLTSAGLSTFRIITEDINDETTVGDSPTTSGHTTLPEKHEQDLNTLSSEYFGSKNNLPTTQKISETTHLPLEQSLDTLQKISASELLDQLLSTTNIGEINTELIHTRPPSINNDNNDDERFDITTEKEIKSPDAKTDINNATDEFIIKVMDNTETTTTRLTIMDSIEQLLSQAVGNVEETLVNINDTHKIHDMLTGSTKKNMTDIQSESATLASTMIEMNFDRNEENENGTSETTVSEITADDSNILSESVGSLLSQINDHNKPNMTTIEYDEPTEKYSTTSDWDDKDESDIERLLTTENFEDTTDDDDEDDDDDDDDDDDETTENHEKEFEDQESPVDTTTSNYVSLNTKLDNDSDKNFESESHLINITIVSSEDTGDEAANKTKPAKSDVSLEHSLDEELKKNMTLFLNKEGTTNRPLVSVESSIENASDLNNPNEILKTEETMSALHNNTSINEESQQGIKEQEQLITVNPVTTVLDLFPEKTTEATTEKDDPVPTTTDFPIKEPSKITKRPATVIIIKRTKRPTNEETTSLPTIKENDPTDVTVEPTTTNSEYFEHTGYVKESDRDKILQTTTEFLPVEYSQTTTEAVKDIEPSIDIIINENHKLPSENISTSVTPNNRPTEDVTTHNSENIDENSGPQETSNIDIKIPSDEISGHETEEHSNRPIQDELTNNSNEDKSESTWTLVPTIAPHSDERIQNFSPPTQNFPEIVEPPAPIDLIAKPLQGFGLEDSTSRLDTDIYQFAQLCNELAFGFWKTVTTGISSARSVFVSPFGVTSLLAMVFLGARGATSGEMNEILRLDDMVTFNPHLIFKNVSESIKTDEPDSGVASSAIIRELFSDRSKGKLLPFYKERAKAFYDGYVEEVSFREIGDVIRRRTNLQVKKYTNGKLAEFLKDTSIVAGSPLAGISVNIFQTDCSIASTEGRDGELHFVVHPSIRQRRLIPVPAVVYKSGFLAGYEPSVDATAVAIGTKDQTVSTILVIPGQQGIATPGDGLARLEKRLVESSFKKGAWSRLLRSLIPRPGLEVQIPRFAHRSVINVTVTLKKMGLHELFDVEKADLRGLNGVANELYLSDMLQVNSFATCGEKRIGETHHSEIYPASTTSSRNARHLENYQSDNVYYRTDLLEEPRDYQRAFHDPLHDPSYLSLPLSQRPRQARVPETPRLKFDRPFIYFVRHNPTGLILHMGRFNPRLLP